MSNPAFTPDLAAALREEFAHPTHRSVSHIADELGVSKGALAGFLYRQGIKSPKRAPVVRLDAERVRAVLEECYSYKSTARRLNISIARLTAFCRRHEMVSPEERDRIERAAQRAAERALAPQRPLHPHRPGRFRFFGPKPSEAQRLRVVSDMRRLADAAIAAGFPIKKCRPGYAVGSLNSVWENLR